MIHRLLGLSLAALALAVPTTAQGSSRLSIEASVQPAVARPGDEVLLEVICDIELGYHIYGASNDDSPTRLVLSEVPGLEPVGEPVIPLGVPHESFGDTSFWIEDSATLQQRFKVTDAAANGALTIRGEVQYMACTPEFCDPPAQDRFKARLTIEGAKSSEPVTEGPFGGGRLQIHTTMKPAVVKPGDEVLLEVDCAIGHGYHIYGAENGNSPTRLVITAAPGLEAIGEPEIPMGFPHGPDFWVESSARLVQKFKVTDEAVTGTLRLQGQVEYMACTVEFCDPPATDEFRATVQIEGGKAPSGEPGDGVVQPGETNGDPVIPAEAESGTSGRAVKVRQPKFSLDELGAGMGSLWSLILLCIGGGLIALIMPCTYPMIPITFSFFTKQAEARGGRVLPLALTYGAGIVVIFILIGLLVGPIIIEFASHWATNFVIGGAFVFFALVLFGWINLQPPQFVTRAAGKASTAGGLLGVFLMGATLVVTSFTCTAPIVGSLLAGAGSGQYSKPDVAIGMGFFGLTMATPFVFLALLPGKVKQLPSSGDWMHTLKVSLGFIELAAALKFLSNADVVLDWKMMPREVFLFLWSFVFILLALFLFGLFRPKGQPVTGVSTARNSCGIAALGFAVYCAAGGSGLRLDFVMTAFEPPYQLRAVEEHLIITDDYEAAVALAKEEKKYLLINFTGFN